MTAIIALKDHNDEVWIAWDGRWNNGAFIAAEEPKVFSPEWSDYFVGLSWDKWYFDILKAYQEEIFPKSFNHHKDFLEFYKKFKSHLQDFGIDGKKLDDGYAPDATIIIATPTSIHRICTGCGVESKNSKWSITGAGVWQDFIMWYLDCYLKNSVGATYKWIIKWYEALNQFEITTGRKAYLYNVTDDMNGKKAHQLSD